MTCGCAFSELTSSQGTWLNSSLFNSKQYFESCSISILILPLRFDDVTRESSAYAILYLVSLCGSSIVGVHTATKTTGKNTRMTRRSESLI